MHDKGAFTILIFTKKCWKWEVMLDLKDIHFAAQMKRNFVVVIILLLTSY